MMRASTLSLLLLVSAPCGAASANAPQSSIINISTIACLNERDTIPKLRVLRMSDRTLSHMFLDGPTSLAIPVASEARAVARGVYEFKASLPAGNYEFYASANRCNGQAMAVMLAGRERSITLSLDQGGSLFDHDHAALAAIVDAPGVQFELISADKPDLRRIALLEGDAVYFDSLRRIRWLLNIRVGAKVATFPVDLTSAHPGDYATLTLSIADVLRRIGQRGPFFSDPVDISIMQDMVWYANPGRHTVGHVGKNGKHVVFTLPIDWFPVVVRADRAGGAWFTEWGTARLGHVDKSGAFTQEVLRKSDDQHWQNFSLLSAGDNAYALAWNADTAYLLRAGSAPQPFPMPDGIEVFQAGFDVAGALWLGSSSAQQAARLDEFGFQLQSTPSVDVDDKVRSAKDIFFSVPSRYGTVSPSGTRSEHGIASVVAAERFGKVDFSSGYTAVRDDDLLGAWLSDCDGKRVLHIRMSKIVRTYALKESECPYDMAADGNGGLWYASGSRGSIAHLRVSGDSLRLPLPRSNVLPSALRVDGDGTLWFIETGANRIAHTAGAGISEIDLGNPGATPTFTIIP